MSDRAANNRPITCNGAWHGEAVQGGERLGAARLGVAGRGWAGIGKARQGKHFNYLRKFNDVETAPATGDRQKT